MKLTRVTADHISEWSALYVDGKLDTVGDSYLIDERIRTLTGVEEIEGDFLLGGEYQENAARTLDEISLFEEELERRRAKAAELRAQAQALLLEASNTLKGE